MGGTFTVGTTCKAQTREESRDTGNAHFSTTVPISMQVFSAALRYSGSGCATFTKSACYQRVRGRNGGSEHVKHAVHPVNLTDRREESNKG